MIAHSMARALGRLPMYDSETIIALGVDDESADLEALSAAAAAARVSGNYRQ